MGNVEEAIIKLRKLNYGYKSIASILNISRDQVRYYCQKHDLKGEKGLRNSPVKRKYKDKICKNCNKNYLHHVKENSSVYCSDECRSGYKIKKQKKEVKKCLVCDTELTNSWKFCSENCRNFQSKKRFLKVCKYCSKEYHTDRDEKSFCSKKCQMKQRSFERIREHEKIYIEKFNKIYENKFIITGEYSGTKNPIQIQCLKCSKSYYKKRAGHLVNREKNEHRCRYCNPVMLSEGETIIWEWLNDNLMNAEKEVVIDVLHNNERHLLKIDFMFDWFGKRYAIEYDGKQHFPNDQSIFKDEHRVIYDKLKNKYCIDNDIRLIRIPYWETNRIEEILECFVGMPIHNYVVNSDNWEHESYLGLEKSR